MPSPFASPTLVSLTNPPDPELELLAIPGAGAGPSSFSPWCRPVPKTWRLTAVCLPGRGARLGQPFLTSIDEAADYIAEAAGAELGRPLVLFGHSMGGIIAVEVAARLKAAAVVVAGSAPVKRRLYTMDLPEDLVRDTARQIIRAGGVPESRLLEELVDVAAPIMRADMLMLHDYEPIATPIDCDILAYYGTKDVIAMEPWSKATTAQAPVVQYPGDHYFIQHSAPWLLNDMSERLAFVSPGTGRG